MPLGPCGPLYSCVPTFMSSVLGLWLLHFGFQFLSSSQQCLVALKSVNGSYLAELPGSMLKPCNSTGIRIAQWVLRGTRGAAWKCSGPYSVGIQLRFPLGLHGKCSWPLSHGPALTLLTVPDSGVLLLQIQGHIYWNTDLFHCPSTSLTPTIPKLYQEWVGSQVDLAGPPSLS